MIDWPTTGIALSALSADARLDRQTFEARYARGFFIRHGASSAISKGPMRTRSQPGEGGDKTGEVTMLVLPIVRRPESQHAFVSVGRVDGNDIAIFDDTISKFHAYVKELPDRTFTLQDAKSRNGTSVDDVVVAKRGEGPPVPLRSGQTVRFGSVTTTFLDGPALIALVTQMSRGRT